VACPHYTCEALVYAALGLLFLSPGKGKRANGTAALLAVWVAVNLGVTANKTRRWYRER
jgi:3-oxo-5-alpha-steroid 4-dehydrogenase 3 / polyprenol reductase